MIVQVWVTCCTPRVERRTLAEKLIDGGVRVYMPERNHKKKLSEGGRERQGVDARV